MKYVLDASVALKWVLAEEDSDKALRLRDDLRQRIHEPLTVDFYPVEVAHALTRAERRKVIQTGQAVMLLGEVLSTAIPMHLHGSLLFRAVSLSSSFQSGVYDCVYVALAERENCELVTADDKLVAKLQSAFPFVISLASLP